MRGRGNADILAEMHGPLHHCGAAASCREFHLCGVTASGRRSFQIRVSHLRQ
jgi:hypothetical protein